MTIAVILILAVLWVAVLAPPILRARDRQERADSVGSFTHQLGLLGRANGTHHPLPKIRRRRAAPLMGPVGAAPPAMSDCQRRRRDLLLTLLALAGLSFVVAVVTRSTPVFAAHALVDVVLGAYVYLLVQHKQRTQPPHRPARVLADEVRGAAPVYYLGDHHASHRPEAMPRLVPMRQSASR